MKGSGIYKMVKTFVKMNGLIVVYVFDISGSVFLKFWNSYLYIYIWILVNEISTVKDNK